MRGIFGSCAVGFGIRPLPAQKDNPREREEKKRKREIQREKEKKRIREEGKKSKRRERKEKERESRRREREKKRHTRREEEESSVKRGDPFIYHRVWSLKRGDPFIFHRFENVVPAPQKKECYQKTEMFKLPKKEKSVQEASVGPATTDERPLFLYI